MGISLSAGVRQSLQSLQSTAMSAQTAQSRLSTGKRVNSAIDNPVNFFTANALNDRADNLKNLLDGMSNTVQTIKAAATGVDGITKLVKSLQSTVKQALSDAAQNRPNKAGNALATAAEATATGKTLQQIALDKKLEGAATAATATSDGTLGVAANAVITLSNGKSSFTFNSNATATVRDLVNNINQSGVATASVDQNGKIALTGAGSENFTFSVGAAGASNTNVGFVAGDATTATAVRHRR
jgi:flagellin-like hook-associated protein FlgL